jgi:HSP20 family molecular chaperone IbpA
MKIIYPITSLAVVLSAHDEANPDAYMYSGGRPNFGPNAVRFSVKNPCPPGTDCFSSSSERTSNNNSRSERYRQRRERVNKAFAEMQQEMMKDAQMANDGQRYWRYREWPVMGRDFKDVDKEEVKKWVDRAFDLATDWNKDFTPSQKERDSNEEILDQTRKLVDNLYKQETEVADDAGIVPEASSDGSKQPSEVNNSSDPTTDEPRSEVPYSENRSNDNVFQVAVDLPGVDRADIDIAFQSNFFTIEAIRRPLEGGKEGRKYMKKFELLDDEVDVDMIEATLQNGVLMVTAPKKKKEELKRKIPVV